jgi:hypothetical protein
MKIVSLPPPPPIFESDPQTATLWLEAAGDLKVRVDSKQLIGAIDRWFAVVSLKLHLRPPSFKLDQYSSDSVTATRGTFIQQNTDSSNLSHTPQNRR